MSTKTKTWLLCILVLAIAGGGYGYRQFRGDTAPAAASAACARHGVGQCPFCTPEVVAAAAICQEHGVPEAICSRCRKELEAVFRAEGDWCGGHGLPESQCERCNPGVLAKWQKPASAACARHGVGQCPFCTPEVVAAAAICQEHGVPEAICSRCRKELEAVFRAEGDWCGGHGLPESQCERCNPGVLAKWQKPAPASPPPHDIEVAASDTPRPLRSPSVDCQTGSRIVRFANRDIAARAGLQFAEVVRAPLRQFLEAPAELEYDARHHARLAPRAPGTVVEVRCGLGDRVDAGSVLLVVDSPALGASKSELLQAAARVRLWERNLAREQRLLEQSLTTEKHLLEAETQLAESRIAVTAAEQRLRSLGLDAGQIGAVREQQDTSSQLQLQAPFAGTVVAHTAVMGQLADPATALVAVADTEAIWAMVDVDQAEVGNVAIDQAVLLTVPGLRGETFGGRVTWISTEVDPRTRTIKVRAELANPKGALRAGNFASARIVTRDGQEATLVPKAAVQWEGCCNVAFVRTSATEFAPRKLRLGYATGDSYEVLAGLEGGEQVVTQGSFLLKTEIMKDSIGAGCCDIDHLGK